MIQVPTFLILLARKLLKEQALKNNKKILETIGKFSNPSKTSLPLQEQIKLIKDFSNKFLKADEIAKYFNETTTTLINKIKAAPHLISQKLGELTAAQRKAVGLFIQSEAEEAGIDSSPLSSSWLAYGIWKPLGVSQTTGTLELTLKNGKTYIYPGVDIYIWNAMKAAKGKNGSGAGSVFWALYLRSYKATYGSKFFQR